MNASTTGMGFGTLREEVVPKPLPLRRRELSITVPRVELRLYRRTRTSSDVVSRPPHFVYLLKCEWTGEQLPRHMATGSSVRKASPARGSESPRAASQRSPRSLLESWKEFEDPWPWWDSLPESYTIRRRWQDIVRFHEALVTELAFDSASNLRRVKARVPTLPETGDVNKWLNGYAAIGDACCLGREIASECLPEDKGRCLEELRDLHWMYVKNRLQPYFVEVNAVLQELPTEILGASTSLRRFVTGGVSGRQQASNTPVQSRFLGPTPLIPTREETAAAFPLFRSASSPVSLLDQRRSAQDDELGKHNISTSSASTTAAARLVLANKR